MKLLILTALVALAVGHGHHEHDKYEKKKEHKPEVLSADYLPHIQDFKDEFALLTSRPSGRPDFGDILKQVEKKYKEAKENLKSVGGHDHHHDHEYKKAYKQLKKHKYEIKDKVEEWKWQMEQEIKKEQEALKKAAIEAVLKGFDPLNSDLFKTRPTGRPEFRDLMKKIDRKYEEAVENLKNSATPSKHGHHHHDHDMKKVIDELWKKAEEAKKTVRDWKKQVDEDALQALLAASPFGSALDSFKQDFESDFSGRPTVRPDVHKFMKDLERKYHEAKYNLKGLRPTGRPSHEDHDLFKKAEKQLKKHYYDAWDKVEAWKKQVEAARHKHHHEDHHKKHDKHHH